MVAPSALPALTRKLVLGCALDEDRPAAAAVHQVQRVLEADPLGRLLQLLVADLEEKAGQVARQ
jgi:hypothetical protein